MFVAFRCFMKMSSAVDDDDEDGAAVDPYPQTEQRDMEMKVYLGSRPFMQHFQTQFYDLARRLGKGSMTSGARVLDPRIMCREEREEGGGEDGSFAKESRLDFIPTVDVAFWPDEAIDWYLKKRPKVSYKTEINLPSCIYMIIIAIFARCVTVAQTLSTSGRLPRSSLRRSESASTWCRWASWSPSAAG